MFKKNNKPKRTLFFYRFCYIIKIKMGNCYNIRLVYNVVQYLNIRMDYPFIQGISDIQETEAMAGSRTTLPFSPRNNQIIGNFNLGAYLPNDSQFNLEQQQQNNRSYTSLRQYVEKTLSSWGMKLGYMPQNNENKMAINCFMQLISQRFSDQQNRQNLKKLLNETAFERNRFQSLYQQQKAGHNQKNKMLGRYQNIVKDYKDKMKQAEQASKKQKQEDKKMISMLKSKNQQILHEIKKRQQQTNRVKQQMKKSVGQKGPAKNISFQVFQIFKKQQADQLSDKVQVLTQKYESQRKNLMRQNLLLRQKLYNIRQQIVGFAEWIDSNIFKQPKPNYKNKFLINHNLLFKKQSIVDEFNQILSDARTGIQQILNMHMENRKTLQPRKADKGHFQSNDYSNDYQQNLSPNKITKQPTDFKRFEQRQTMGAMGTQKKSGSIYQKYKQRPSVPMMKKRTVSLQPQGLQPKEEESELSMISHISGAEIVEQNNKFDKWDILFNNDQD